ncbi:MAG: MarR family transcriptional regulator [Burkholderiaceae bacterium]
MKQNQLANHTEATVLQLLETASILERSLDGALSNTRGISFSEYRLLRALANGNAGGSPRIDLAKAIGLTASAVTRALKPLEKLGYVTTQKSERDARQSRAVITTAGRELLDDAQGVLRDMLRPLAINRLGPQEVADFRDRLGELR